MGYVSDIAIAFYPLEGGDIEVVNLWFDNYRPKLNEYRLLDLFCHRTDMLLFQWGAVKWYTGYPEITLIEGMFSDYKDNFNMENYAYEYVRLGEDIDDIEKYNSHGDSKIYVYRNIKIA